ncbi:hypothetical protein QAD02_007173 [Eretmocerus hayati]|uniref:Uncharacterized protein n=1 Tax=Eretmocerus hayati TaxID=131215 RepID=A0ACC2N3A0_9HYME|nr:hypothetical protein QAD02_007173 [Eretmocerus hayati]
MAKHSLYIWIGIRIIPSATNIESSHSNNDTDIIPLSSIIQNSSIEEADLRIILHATHAVLDGYKKVVVASIDTDVLVPLLHHWEALNRPGSQALWNLRSGTDSNKSQIPVHAMALGIGLDKCKTLPAMHHLMGSDYTSKVGTKCSGFQTSPEMFLLDLGTDVSEAGIQDAVEKTESYLVKVLSRKTNCESFDHLRLWIYEYEQSTTIAYSPPSSEFMKSHIFRAFYITYMQISCLDVEAKELDIFNFGYTKRDIHTPRQGWNIPA